MCYRATADRKCVVHGRNCPLLTESDLEGGAAPPKAWASALPALRNVAGLGISQTALDRAYLRRGHAPVNVMVAFAPPTGLRSTTAKPAAQGAARALAGP